MSYTPLDRRHPVREHGRKDRGRAVVARAMKLALGTEFQPSADVIIGRRELHRDAQLACAGAVSAAIEMPVELAALVVTDEVQRLEEAEELIAIPPVQLRDHGGDALVDPARVAARRDPRGRGLAVILAFLHELPRVP